jgi:hypothetical protein
LEAQIAELDPQGQLRSQWQSAEAEVQKIIDEGRILDAFRGKPIFDAFFEAHAKHSGLPKRAFAYAVAATAAGRSRAERLVTSAARRIDSYVPSVLVEAVNDLEEVCGPSVDTEIRRDAQAIRDARLAWEEERALPAPAEVLRARCVSLARVADGLGRPDLATRIRTATASLAPRTAISEAGRRPISPVDLS